MKENKQKEGGQPSFCVLQKEKHEKRMFRVAV